MDVIWVVYNPDHLKSTAREKSGKGVSEDKYCLPQFSPKTGKTSSVWTIRYAYGTAFWSIKAQISTRRQIQAEPEASACIGDKYRSEPLSTKKQCHMHFIVRPPTCVTDN